MKSLFDAHKKDALPDEQANVLREMKTILQDYPARQEAEEKARWKMITFAKQIGLNIAGLPDGETAIQMKILQRSEAHKKGRRQCGRH